MSHPLLLLYCVVLSDSSGVFYLQIRAVSFVILEGKSADYMITGTWSDKAAIEVVCGLWY